MKTTSLFLVSALFFTQSHAYILPQHSIKAYECSSCEKLSHQALNTSWNIVEMPFLQPSPNDQKSYSYTQVVSGGELNQGVPILTRAPGAVVRVTPLKNETTPALELQTPQNKTLSLKSASALYAQDDAASESMMGMEHQTLLQIKPELGSGTFVLKSKANSTAADNNSYQLNIFDKFSLIYMQVKPNLLHYRYGDEFTADIILTDNENDYPLENISATLISPDDQTLPLKVTQLKRNHFQASTTLLSDQSPRGNNWYIEVKASGTVNSGYISRTARVAFSYAIPSATLLSIKKVSSKPLTFEVTLDVATGSRYALQSVLFAKNASGNLAPIETAQSAQWLAPGKQTIKFSFDNPHNLTEDKLSVGYLHLTDYGQLKTVYQYDHPIKLGKLLD